MGCFKHVSRLAVLLACLCNAAFAEEQASLELDYAVPDGFVSVKAALAGGELPPEQVTALEGMFAHMERTLGSPLLDLLIPPNEPSDRFWTMAISFYPTTDDEPTADIWFDEAFTLMQQAASTLPDPVDIKRRRLQPENAYGFDRMDVENAYGRSGDYASFLTRKLHGHYLDVLIVSNFDPQTPLFDEVIKSFRVVLKDVN